MAAPATAKHPPFPRILKAEKIPIAVESIIERYNQLHHQLIQAVTPATACFENVIRPLTLLDNDRISCDFSLEVLSYLSPDRATCKAAGEGNARFNEAVATWKSRSSLFHLVKAVSDKDEPLDKESKLWIKYELCEYTALGHGILDDAEIPRFVEEQVAISKLANGIVLDIRQPLPDDGIWIATGELAGAPQASLDSLRRREDGKYLVPLGRSQFFQAKAEREETRLKLFAANERRSANINKRLKEVAVRRDAQARRLGYSSHAAVRLENLASPSVEWVTDQIDSFQRELSVRGKIRYEDVRRERKAKQERTENIAHGIVDPDDCLPPWDVPFFQNILRAKKSSTDEKRGPGNLQEYFPFQNTLTKLLILSSSCLGLVCRLVPPGEVGPDFIWHDDVQIWAFWESTDEEAFLGFLYFDLFQRDGKNLGIYNMTMQQGFSKADGTRQYPVSVVCCNFSKPAENRCILLAHNKLVSLFHELGHGLHDLVSKTRYARFHGTRLADDVCETPSIMLENFCWTSQFLKIIGHHYTALKPEYLAAWKEDNPGCEAPPVSIPDDIMAEFLKSRVGSDLHRFVMVLETAMLDWKLHNPPSHQAILDLDPSEAYNDIRADLRGIEDSKGRHRGLGGLPINGLSGLVSGYDAAKFVNVCAAAYAQDMFASAFADDPLNKEAWGRYRRDILEPGGSSGDEIGMLEKFIGRKMSLDAFFAVLE